MAGCLMERVAANFVERSLQPSPWLAMADAVRRTRHVIVSHGEARLELESQSQGNRNGDLRLRHFEIESVAAPHGAVKRTQTVDKPSQLLVLVIAVMLLACVPVTS